MSQHEEDADKPCEDCGVPLFDHGPACNSVNKTLWRERHNLTDYEHRRCPATLTLGSDVFRCEKAVGHPHTHGAQTGPSYSAWFDQHMFGNVTEQPAPDLDQDGAAAVWDLVIADMRQRDAFGAAKYRTRLHAFNGRDSLRDAYEELLDGAVYLRLCMVEQEARKRVAEAILRVHRREDWQTVEQAYCSTCDRGGPVNWPCDAARLAQIVLGREEL